MSFYHTCQALNIDVVAGCDYNEHMRKRFLEANPGALVTADDEEFLAGDFDAVLLATYCPDHAGDAIRALKAGKHVLSEVTSFHTVAEGVKLVETVEKTGLVYNLAENYPFSAGNMYLAARWREGLFGELMYAEYEYVHECRSLCYTYIDGVPVKPGWTVHNWRSWINYHYYNTHSLGPVMIITGRRPVRVVALPGEQHLPGYLVPPLEGMGGVAPSLINMDNGAVMRNLMGATTNDSHIQRLWGTKGSAEICGGLFLRLGGAGGSPKLQVQPKWDELGELAARTGHGGGDFWVLYYFARQILHGIPAPFDIYAAADCTLPGILAVRSSLNGGRPYDVPDLRKKSDRDKHRRDDWAQPRYDVGKGCFPRGADHRVTGRFSTVMRDLIHHALVYRAWADWSKVTDSMQEPERVVEMADRLIETHGEMRRVMRAARRIVQAYPRSDGARVLREMLQEADEEVTGRPAFLDEVKRRRAALQRRIRARKGQGA
jgi:hypothetical protein